MASANRTTPDALELFAALESRPYKFNFFQAMRLLESVYRDRPRLGEATRAGDDPVRLGQEPSMAFATSMVAGFEPGDADKPDYLSGFFFGLFGPNGPLPLHLTEYARGRERHEHDATFRRFADMFHHRMLSLFYRAWANKEPTVNFDRPESDNFSKYVGALIGIGLPGYRDRDALPDHTKLYLAGRLALQARPVEGLRAALEEYMEIPTKVAEFVGEWLKLPQSGRMCLGESELTGALGQSTTVGAKVWDCQHKFRVICGPMGLVDFERLLPGNGSLPRLASLVRNYVGDELDWDLNLVLLSEEVPEMKLGQAGRLGWTSWLGRWESDQDASDVLIRPQEYA